MYISMGTLAIALFVGAIILGLKQDSQNWRAKRDFEKKYKAMKESREAADQYIKENFQQ